MEIQNGALVVDVDGSTMTVPLPEVPVAATVKAWRVPEAYRPGNLFIAVTLPGQPEDVPACNPADAVLLGVLTLEPTEAATLAAAKAAKLAEVNEACERDGAALLAGYPESEIKTWPQQATEAAAHVADPDADTPLLDAIAQARGLTVDDLAGRVLTKETMYKAAAGGLLGKRQSLEDLIDVAATLEDVAAITW